MLLQDPSLFQPSRDAEISEYHPRASDCSGHSPHPHDSEETHWDCQHWMLVWPGAQGEAVYLQRGQDGAARWASQAGGVLNSGDLRQIT